jgi:ribosomal protein S18 acetylase RimI-like enzyme
MKDVKIRQVTEQDLEACYRLESRCFPPDEAASRENIEKRIKLFPQGFFVAESNGTIVGLVNSGLSHKEDLTDEAIKAMIGHDKEGENMVIFSLAVTPELRKTGVARRLMLRVIAEGKKLKKKKVMALCKPRLVTYYQGYGFIHAGESASTHGGSRWQEIILPLD